MSSSRDARGSARSGRLGRTRALLLLVAAAGCGPTAPASHARAWAAGDRGVTRSDDGGAIWTALEPPQQLALAAVRFVSRRHGWTVGGGEILVTRDGGDQFESQRANTDIDAAASPFLASLSFADALRGVVAGSLVEGGKAHAFVLYTTDAGEHWTTASVETVRPPDPMSGSTIQDVCIGAGGIGLAAGHDGPRPLVLLSRDAGASWSDVSERTGASLSRVVACVGDELWLGGGASGVQIIRSTDGGESFVDLSGNLPVGVTGSVASLFFLDAQRGWLAGPGPDPKGRPLLLRTTDGGDRWVDVTPPVHGRFQAVAFAPAEGDVIAGIVVGDDGGGAAEVVPLALQSLDSGDTWRGPTRTLLTGPLRSVALVP